MARAVLENPRALALPPEEAAIAGLASIVTDAPWTVSAEDLERATAAGLSADSVLHVVVQAAFFNYLNRVADGVGIELDYTSELPRMPRVDGEPLPRPERSQWRERSLLDLASRPASFEIYEKWRRHLLDRDAPLSRRDRRVVRKAAALALCDLATVNELGDAAPRDGREQRLAEYTTLLTAAPWRLNEAALAPLRSEGLDDRALLDVISVGAFQNTDSRLRVG